MRSRRLQPCTADRPEIDAAPAHLKSLVAVSGMQAEAGTPLREKARTAGVRRVAGYRKPTGTALVRDTRSGIQCENVGKYLGRR